LFRTVVVLPKLIYSLAKGGLITGSQRKAYTPAKAADSLVTFLGET
jgi:hypothetical protein